MNTKELFDLIRNTPGTNEKSAIIKANLTDELRAILAYTYTRDRYHVRPTNIDVSVHGTDDILNVFNTYPKNVLNSLKNGEISGNDAINAVNGVIGKLDETGGQIFLGVLDHNLELGVSSTIIKELGMDDKFEVALAMKLQDQKNVDVFDGTWFVSRKLDGTRTIAEVDCETRKVKFLSRQNKEFTTLSRLIDPILSRFPETEGIFYLDGEICVMDDQGNEDFKGVMSEVRRKNYTMEHPVYNVFDFLTYDEFWGKTKSPEFSIRHQAIIDRKFDGDFVRPLKQELVTSEEQFLAWKEEVKKGDWEGLMLRKNAPYLRGRTKELLKVKDMQDAEYVVKDVQIGSMTFAVQGEGQKVFDNVVTALIIEHNGNNVYVGSGLSKEQRIAWAKDPSAIIGKTITVQYFEITTNKDGSESLRFPILKFAYDNGRNC